LQASWTAPPGGRGGYADAHVFVKVENPESTLLGGMFATGEVVLAEAAEAIAVPASRIREEGARMS
jgi:hypothetical protein